MLNLDSIDIDLLPINIAIYQKIDDDFIFQNFNTLAEKTEKISRKDIIGKKLTEVFPSVKEFGLFDVLLRVEKSGNPEFFDVHYYKDARIDGWRKNHVVKLDNGLVAAFYDDCTLKKEKEKKIFEQSNLLQTIVNLIPDLIWLKDPEGKYLACNATVERFYGTKESNIIGKTDFDFVDAASAKSFQDNDLLAIKQDGYRSNEEIIRSSDGSYEGYFETIKTPMKDSKGNLIGVLGIARDITERKEKEEKLQTYANYDHLTGLANRSLFINRLKHLLNHRESVTKHHAVLFIDLDNFKDINDTMGHDTGDLVLKEIAMLLQKLVRKEDTVARIGGDEFTILLENISSPYDAGIIAHKIIDTLQNAIKIKKKHFYISASIGIAISPDNTLDSDHLLSYADTAMYHAKAIGKNNYQFYTKDFSNQAFEKLLVENDLRNALKNEEFTLYYQPQINIQKKEIIGVEALLRWNHPQRGMILPIHFMKIAESSGQFNAIGKWVIKQAMKDIIQWKKMKLDLKTISINLSIKQLKDQTLIPTIETLLKETNCHPSWIEFEITEKYIMSDDKTTIEKLTQINKLGCKIAIENFGMGYSSLINLQHLPIQKVIINQPFIRPIPGNSDNETIVSTLILIAKKLNLEIISKCIETQEQEQFLLHNHCHYGQGFLYTKPMSNIKLETYINYFKGVVNS